MGDLIFTGFSALSEMATASEALTSELFPDLISRSTLTTPSASSSEATLMMCQTISFHYVFPSQHLKTIRLQSLVLRGGFVRLLNCDCPVLEHLEIEQSDLWDLNKISSRSLKVLHISDCQLTSGLLICARNLTHLSILDTEIGGIVTRDLSCLVTALISLIPKYFHHKYTVLDHHLHLLDGLSHSTTLELHAPLHEV